MSIIAVIDLLLFFYIATIGADYLVSSWSFTFMAGQSQYNQSTSCVSMFIINDTILEDTEYLTLGFISANRTKYLPFRTDVTFTIYEDLNDSMFCAIRCSSFL